MAARNTYGGNVGRSKQRSIKDFVPGLRRRLSNGEECIVVEKLRNISEQRFERELKAASLGFIKSGERYKVVSLG